MNKVTNNHDSTLGVAGVEIKPSATVGIDTTALRNALGSNAVKQWIKLGILGIEGLEELQEDSDDPVVPAAPVIPGVPGAGGSNEPTREQLEARATELEISFQGNTKDETLVKKIAEAEEALTKPE